MEPTLLWEGKPKNVPLDKKFLFSSDTKGPWENLLFKGDCLEFLYFLRNTPEMFNRLKELGGIKLIYIDPPFNVGKKFFDKNGNFAYSDIWENGINGYLTMIYERLVLMRDLLAEDGSIYVHCDWRVNSFTRLILDEIFAKERLINEIIWRYRRWTADAKNYQRMHDTILWATKSNNYIFNRQYEPFSEKTVIAQYKRKVEGGRAVQDKTQEMQRTHEGVSKHDVWDIAFIHPVANERLGYPTQKPEELVKSIIIGSSNENDIIADFFCGSGTTAAVAEKLNRKWICGDIGELAIETTAKRLEKIQGNKNFCFYEKVKV